MAWKISVNIERDPEALQVAQRMIFAAAKAQGASDLEAFAAGPFAARSAQPVGCTPVGDRPGFAGARGGAD